MIVIKKMAVVRLLSCVMVQRWMMIINQSFGYLGTAVTNGNFFREEIKSRLNADSALLPRSSESFDFPSAV
jgi:hypothetical protein